jgi:1,4-alpha-glucan branching enzyme
LGVALVMTSLGIPMIFQGQPMLEDKWFSDDDLLDWSKSADFKGLVQMHRDLISLRRNIHGNINGLTGQNIEILRVDNEKKVIVFRRWQDGGCGDEVVIVMNFSSQSY